MNIYHNTLELLTQVSSSSSESIVRRDEYQSEIAAPTEGTRVAQHIFVWIIIGALAIALLSAIYFLYKGCVSRKQKRASAKAASDVEAQKPSSNFAFEKRLSAESERTLSPPSLYSKQSSYSQKDDGSVYEASIASSAAITRPPAAAAATPGRSNARKL